MILSEEEEEEESFDSALSLSKLKKGGLSRISKIQGEEVEGGEQAKGIYF